MTKLLARLAALLFALAPALAEAQQFPPLADHSVYGRIGTGTGSGPGQAIPWLSLSSNMFGSGAVGTVLTSNGSGNLPTFQSVSGSATDVFLIVGDSIPAGRGNGSGPTVPTGMVLEYCSTGAIQTANDPTCNAVSAAQNANTGSFLPAFGNAYVAATGRRVAFVNTSIGGSTQASAADLGNGNWDTGGSLFTQAIATLNTALTAFAAAGDGPVFRGVIIQLGINDALQINNSVISQGQYQTALSNMLPRFRSATIGGTTYPALPIYYTMSGTINGSSDTGPALVRAAQVTVIGNNFTGLPTQFVFLNTFEFAARGMMQSSSPHPTQAGYNEFGSETATNIASAQAAMAMQKNNLDLYWSKGNVALGYSVADAVLSVSNDLITAPIANAGSLVHFTSSSGSGMQSTWDAYGGGVFLNARSASGSLESPSFPTSSTSLIGLTASGWVSTNTFYLGANITCRANQNWTVSASGTQCEIATTANGGQVRTVGWRFENDGGLTVPPTVTGGSQGAGTINLGTSLTSPIVFGGTAVGSTLTLTSTSNGSPSGDIVQVKTGGTVRQTYLSNGNIGVGKETNPQAALVASANVTTGLTVGLSDLIMVAAADGTAGSAGFQAYNGGSSSFQFRLSGTTAALSSSSAGYPGSGAQMGQISSSGWDQSSGGSGSWSGAKIALRMSSLNAWSGSDNSTFFTFLTTPGSSRTLGQVGRFMQGLIIGTGTTDPGIGNAIASGYLQTGTTTVGSLPSCAAGTEGARFYVTDQNTAVSYRGAVTGGGATRQAVLCSNSAWIQD